WTVRHRRGGTGLGFAWFRHEPAIRPKAIRFNRPLPGAAHRMKLGRAPHRISRIHKRGSGMRIAVIGTGIAGSAAAWALSKRYPVTVYDRELRPGGHSH